MEKLILTEALLFSNNLEYTSAIMTCLLVLEAFNKSSKLFPCRHSNSLLFYQISLHYEASEDPRGQALSESLAVINFSPGWIKQSKMKHDIPAVTTNIRSSYHMVSNNTQSWKQPSNNKSRSNLALWILARHCF